MSSDKYIMSFTTGGLFRQESVKLATLYLVLGDWKDVRDKAIAENLLQARTLNTLKRICREIIARLETLSFEELEFLIKANDQDQAYLLWITVCRRYRFIADFAVEVLRERYLSLQTNLSHEDFDIFFNRKSEWHAELERIKPATREKLRQVLFRILRDAGLLTNNNLINFIIPDSKIFIPILREKRRDLLFFPVLESDLKEYIRE